MSKVKENEDLFNSGIYSVSIKEKRNILFKINDKKKYKRYTKSNIRIKRRSKKVCMIYCYFFLRFINQSGLL